MIDGPEKTTFVERLAGVFRLPYSLGCLIISFIIGPGGAFLVGYLGTGNMERAFSMAVILFAGAESAFLNDLAILALFWLLLFYVLYMTRFMRKRIISTEDALLPVLPKGEETFHVAFRQISKLWPPVVLAILFLVFYFAASGFDLTTMFSPSATYIFYTVFVAIAYPLWFLSFCTFAWVFFSSILGLYKLGKKILILKSSTEDRMLGMKPFGDLSLSLSIVYFIAMGILLTIALTAFLGLNIADAAIAFVSLMTILSIVGIAFFIVPLYAVHRRMVVQKAEERMQLRKRAYEHLEVQKGPAAQDATAEMKKKLDSLTSLMTLEMAEKNLNTVPDWPIDTPMISRFVTIVLSVTAIILANIILRFLHL